MAIETTSALIVGCGPTGAMLSALLGQYHVPNIVLEREAEVNVDPRGIALDEDGIRYLQACGLYDKVFTEIGTCRCAQLDILLGLAFSNCS
jgi:2-polyprenyl-6-methoxyphenol hydroxylase-like FAD-dependent oxidoreductase